MLTLLDGGVLRCVWSDTLAMDQCLPFAVWPCDDLWNLLPVHREVNGKKRDRSALTTYEVFSGLLLQQLRLRHDQQAPVWQGVYSGVGSGDARPRNASQPHALRCILFVMFTTG